MTIIRVDTDELKKIAQQFANSAAIIEMGGNEMLSVAMGLPSYEGQLSTPARSAGYEIQSKTRSVHDKLKTDSDRLFRIAREFEEADRQTVEGLQKSTKDIGDYLRELWGDIGKLGELITETRETLTGVGEYIITQIVTEGVKIITFTLAEVLAVIQNDLEGHIKGGNIFMGYDWDPNTGVLILWVGTDFKILQFDPNTESFPANIDMFMEKIDELDNAGAALIIAGITAVGSIFSFLGAIPTGAGTTPISWGFIAGGVILGLTTLAALAIAAGMTWDAFANCLSLWKGIKNNPSSNETLPEKQNSNPGDNSDPSLAPGTG